MAERLAALPGVEAVGLGTPPLSLGVGAQNFTLETPSIDAAIAESWGVADWREAGPDYFETLGMPLLAGRAFTAQDQQLHLRAIRGRDGIGRDDADALRALRRSIELPVVVNKTMARFFWGGEKAAIGKSFYWGRQGDPGLIDSGSYDSGEWDPRFPIPHRLTIVGVVGDVKTRGLDEEADLQIYWAINSFSNGLSDRFSFQIRTASDRHAVAEAIREGVHAQDPDELSVAELRTMDQTVSEAGAEQRFRMLLISASAGMSLVLVAVGLFGVMAYVASRRAKEIGIRISVGAETRDILLLVGREGCVMTAAGGVIGLAGSAALTRLMSGMLFGVEPLDPLSFGASLLLLVVVGSLACSVPTLRATRVDPVNVLRVD